MDTFDTDITFPPSLDGLPWVTMPVVMAYWITTLLCMQWAWSIIDDALKNRAPRRHPLTYLRQVKLLVLLAILAPAMPRGVMLITWQSLSPFWREGLALASWVSFIPAAVVLGYAWWIDRLVRPLELRAVYLFRASQMPATAPFEKRRGAIIFGLIFVIAFATTFVRPITNVAPARSIIEHR